MVMFILTEIMLPITILFLSSAEISLPLFETLLNDNRFDVQVVFCQPDRPAGRDQFIKKPAPKIIAERHGIPVFQVDKLSKDDSLFDKFSNEPPDFLLTFAYGQILSQRWLDLPKIASINIHTSLLPKYRGASPIQAALLNGDHSTGFTVIKMLKEMDAGPFSLKYKIKIPKHMTAGLLHDEMAESIAKLLPDELLRIANEGDLIFTEQDHSQASFCKKISRQDAYLDFQDSAENILRKFRAYMPWPGLWSTYKGKRLKFIDILKSEISLKPGQIVCNAKNIYIGTTDGSIEVKQLQIEGKQCVHSDQFIIGQPEFCSSSVPS